MATTTEYLRDHVLDTSCMNNGLWETIKQPMAYYYGLSLDTWTGWGIHTHACKQNYMITGIYAWLAGFYLQDCRHGHLRCQSYHSIFPLLHVAWHMGGWPGGKDWRLSRLLSAKCFCSEWYHLLVCLPAVYRNTLYICEELHLTNNNASLQKKMQLSVMSLYSRLIGLLYGIDAQPRQTPMLCYIYICPFPPSV